MVLMIDNYDSFTYNIVQYCLELGADLKVIRNDEMSVEEIAALKPDKIILSPGPATPDDAGVTLDVIERFKDEVPIFGICLGHQSIAQSFGGHVVRAERLMHGKTSMATHDGRTIYEGLSQPFEVGRYHSLCAQPETLPDVLELTAQTERGEIMGVRHKSLPLEGVQFHPESVLTPEGDRLMANFMRMTAP